MLFQSHEASAANFCLAMRRELVAGELDGLHGYLSFIIEFK